MSLPPRAARLVLVTAHGAVVGALPAIPVATPWWQDIAPVVAAVRERWGIEATVLRLLSASLPAPPGGEVTYLAQVDRAVSAEPWDGELDDHPLRLAYAKPSGPAADLAWAMARLSETGRATDGPPVQIRTWNLSSLWRLPCGEGAAWLKVTPPFFAHEGAMLAHLAGSRVPALLARDGVRSLLAEIEGEDLYQATFAQHAAMVDLLVDLQCAQVGRVDDLLALGLPDWRGSALTGALGATVERVGPQLEAADRASLERFLQGLPARWAGLAACGLPDTLVHGDFHSGNFRGAGDVLTLLDWGDSGVGHPLLDQAAFLDRIPKDDVDAARQRWADQWRQRIPGCEPERAARLVVPIAAARQALIYQGFLDHIEPAEHPYHRADPADWLARTADLARQEAEGSIE
jgi:Ser/Thr protein kinase RdoA (MazF antagonist)